MACAGDVPTLETLAAVDLLRQRIPELKIRVVNVVDLMTLQPRERASARPRRPGFRCPVHARQAGDLRLSRLSLSDPPPDLPAHQSRRHSCARLQGGRHHDDAVRHGGSATSSTASTSRSSVINRVPGLAARAAAVKQHCLDRLLEHHDYVRTHGEDMPDIHDWSWPYGTAAEASD